jgi:hypothetical protein
MVFAIFIVQETEVVRLTCKFIAGALLSPHTSQTAVVDQAPFPAQIIILPLVVVTSVHPSGQFTKLKATMVHEGIQDGIVATNVFHF